MSENQAKSRKPWELYEDPEERGRAAKATFDSILEEQSTYRGATLQHMRLYRNLNNLAYVGGGYGVNGLSAPLSLNIVRNMVNAVHSKITKHRVKVTMQTSGAAYEMREKARMLDAYALGLCLKENIYRQTPMAFLDMAVTGTGVMKTFVRNGRVRFERVFSPNLVVDFAEGAYLEPAHYYEICYFDRSWLKRRYKEHEAEITSAAQAKDSGDEFYVFQDSPSADLVQVIQAYYVDPDDEMKGSVSTFLGSTGVELEFRKLKHGNPFSFIRWSSSNLGFYGMGLPEELKGIQLEINRLVRKIQTAFGLLANPYVLADRASSITRGHVTDIPGSFIFYSGKEPKVQAPQTMHPEVFAHLDRLYQRGYEIAGVSQLSAQSQKPQGLESGRSLLIYEDIESDRFADVHRQWDELHVDCVRKGIRAARSIRGYKVQVWGSETMESLEFDDDIGLEEEEWMIRPMPTALLGETPAAQVQNAERLVKSGLISQPEEILEQVTAPDIAAYVLRVTAPKKWIEKTIGSMLAGGPYVSPEPEMNLAMALDLAQGMYSEARLMKGFPQKRLENVRKFMTRTKDLLKMAAASAGPPTMGAVASPGGPPPIPGGQTPPPAPAAPAAAAA